MNRYLLLLVLLFTLTGACAVVLADDHEKPLILVKNTANQMLLELKKRKQELQTNPEKIYELVDHIVLPRFDFVRMSQLALGRYWRRATKAQRHAFVEAFRQLLVRTYAMALLNYSNQEITYKRQQQDPGAKAVTVKTVVSEPGGTPVPIDYRLHRKNGEWRVFDVTVDGVSLVSNYRSSFASQIRRYKMDGLIRNLQSKNKQGGS